MDPSQFELVQKRPLLFKCLRCQSTFQSKKAIQYHEYKCWDKPWPVVCKHCGKGFVSKSQYDCHSPIHTGDQPYQCPKCSKAFSTKSKLIRHLKSSVHNPVKHFMCDNCGKQCASKEGLEVHIRRDHTGKTPYGCSVCKERFSARWTLMKHKKTHEKEEDGDKDASFFCDQCGKTFSKIRSLEMHLKTHAYTEEEQKFGCDFCIKAFVFKKDLLRHLSTHSNERPYGCTLCEWTFKRKGILVRHLRTRHDKSDDEAKEIADKVKEEKHKQRYGDKPSRRRRPPNESKRKKIGNKAEENVKEKEK